MTPVHTERKCFKSPKTISQSNGERRGLGGETKREKKKQNKMRHNQGNPSGDLEKEEINCETNIISIQSEKSRDSHFGQK